MKGNLENNLDYSLHEKLRLKIEPGELMAYMGYKREISPKLKEIEAQAIAIALELSMPRGLARVVPAMEMKQPNRFGDAREVAVCLSTIGASLEEKVKELFASRHTGLGLVLDAAGSLAVEKTADSLAAEIFHRCQMDGIKVTRRFSPGYPGWDISDQTLLFSFLGESPLDVHLTEYFLMIPRKSLSFVMKIGPHVEEADEGSCRRCPQKGCQFKKTGPCIRLAAV